MNWATKSYALFLALLAVIVGTVDGCAAPVVPPTNVIADADVRDCFLGTFEAAGPLDVAIVIDTSLSTRRSAEFDIDRDGSIDRFSRHSAIRRGDSRLAALIAGVRPLLRSAQDHDIRFSIVTFSGASVSRLVGQTRLTGSVRDSRIRADLSSEMLKLDYVLTDVLEAGSGGQTIFFAGMQRAIQSLTASYPQDRRKVVLFMSDSPRSSGLSLTGVAKRFDPRMKNAAISARIHNVVFHTFGVSPNSNSWRQESLGQIAGATGGNYHPVADPRRLYCHLANSLSPSFQQKRSWQSAFEALRALESESFDSDNPTKELPAKQ